MTQFQFVYLPKSVSGMTRYLVSGGGIMLSVFYILHGPAVLAERLPGGILSALLFVFVAYVTSATEHDAE